MRRIPRVNHALIAINIVVYLVTAVSGTGIGDRLQDHFYLCASNPTLSQFLSYQFLHAGLWHLLGNMLFLWVFGNSVNSKMGNPAYLLFYLAAGVFAGVGFALVSDGNLIGASGAIAGITTAYLVLFPRSTVTVFYWLWFYIGAMHVQALLLIALKIILWDNVLAPSLASGAGADPVAYSAHLAGYLFGFVVCSAMLLLRALPRDQYDIIALAKRHHRRQQFKAAMADPNARARATYGRVARPVSVGTGRPAEAVPVAVVDEITRLRAEIGELVAKRDYTTAADRYETLVGKDSTQCLPRANMLLIANRLMTLGRYPQAAAAYERFLKAYPSGADTVQVKLVLGILYAKYLQQYEAAQPYLRECTSRLADPDQLRQAHHWLDAAIAAVRRRPSTA